MKIYGLIGKTLHHSFSARYFSEKFKTDKIPDSQYLNFEMEDLAKEVQSLKKNPEIRGLNVTIPYKTDIIPFLDELTDECQKVNACNCIKIKEGKWIGYNTDIAGFEKSFIPLLKSTHKKALVLGTGGASKAIAFVLEKLNIDFLKVSRKKDESSSVISYDEINEAIMTEFQIVINTTPVGTSPNIDECPDLPYQFITDRHYFFDLVYNPQKTLFLSRAEKQGAFIKNGDDMLIIQAEESWKIWNEKMEQ
ncbi:MAG TPA: shikimate dehydrogenase [Hanamia sp.]